MSVRSGVSGRLAAVLLARCRRHLTRGSAMAVRPSVWRIVPRSVKAWLEYRVLTHVESLALSEVCSHAVLRGFAADMTQDRWTMTPSALHYLWKLLETSRPGRIVEFGSGLSTRLFAEYARRMKAAGQLVTLLSIEHDEHWLEKTRETLQRDQTSEFVAFCHAPISSQQLLGRTLEAYSIDANTFEKCAGPSGFDLCLIDGPPGTIGRAGCLPLAAPYLAADALILLDDALRPGELAIGREWRKKFGRRCLATRLQLLDSHGLMRTTWKGPGVSRIPSVEVPAPRSTAHRGQRSEGSKVSTMNGLS